MAEAFGETKDDEDVTKVIEDTQNTLMVFEDRDWLMWARKMLMPRVYEDMEIERCAEEERKREQEREEAKRQAEEQKREEEERRKQEREEKEEEKRKEKEKREKEKR